MSDKFDKTTTEILEQLGRIKALVDERGKRIKENGKKLDECLKRLKEINDE